MEGILALSTSLSILTAFGAVVDACPARLATVILQEISLFAISASLSVFTTEFAVVDGHSALITGFRVIHIIPHTAGETTCIVITIFTIINARITLYTLPKMLIVPISA